MDLCCSEEMHVASIFIIGRNTVIKWIKAREKITACLWQLSSFIISKTRNLQLPFKQQRESIKNPELTGLGISLLHAR